MFYLKVDHVPACHLTSNEKCHIIARVALLVVSYFSYGLWDHQHSPLSVNAETSAYITELKYTCLMVMRLNTHLYYLY